MAAAAAAAASRGFRARCQVHLAVHDLKIEQSCLPFKVDVRCKKSENYASSVITQVKKRKRMENPKLAQICSFKRHNGTDRTALDKELPLEIIY